MSNSGSLPGKAGGLPTINHIREILASEVYATMTCGDCVDFGYCQKSAQKEADACDSFASRCCNCNYFDEVQEPFKEAYYICEAGNNLVDYDTFVCEEFEYSP